ncbi:arylamine N-acetyltransferase family protein [Alicyclobacillus acidoterrestris]|uniref:Arylamine N-acetyltransferase n=1 Tax=Alicyclobacillus acidoterrestris (strain ATCC 49025 / DSM 3922 / CIP 106132 / NCIMB 13137 / GD3B) TaxID=1356854 RepID=T0BN98_ALIAG|nr:arylamine N-acetyltransferase [Alicyclobacillus acidoterrestris]EPZ42239.1 hypothetical protein N007_15585 [Alicyclobacillus acidoterrestris ATCC 49025]UNO47854.1 arylamine N-acetyltransferase [Alicyclobacillus acidoterrestris]GEO27857.1 acetyltransferase [Alicyclobacillus acidoterrestris]
MQQEDAFSERRVQRYLERIGVFEELEVNYDSLLMIQAQHMLTVPFENLNIVDKKPIELDFYALYEKIVVKRRGGYCYELNGLLAWCLKQLGFEVTVLSGRVRREDGSFGPEFDHMVLMVHLDKDYVVDVGFGDSARRPLPLSGDIMTDVSGQYRITSDTDSQLLLFQKKLNNDWVNQFCFTRTPRQMDDFQEMNVFQQTSPASFFTKGLIVSLATRDGRVTISRDTFIETKGTDKKTRPILSDDERNELLKCYFNIEVV